MVVQEETDGGVRVETASENSCFKKLSYEGRRNTEKGTCEWNLWSEEHQGWSKGGAGNRVEDIEGLVATRTVEVGFNLKRHS